MHFQMGFKHALLAKQMLYLGYCKDYYHWGLHAAGAHESSQVTGWLEGVKPEFSEVECREQGGATPCRFLTSQQPAAPHPPDSRDNRKFSPGCVLCLG